MTNPLRSAIFQDTTKARAWLKSLLWNDGRSCGYCPKLRHSHAKRGSPMRANPYETRRNNITTAALSAMFILVA